MLEPLLEWLPTTGADVLCLQEVTSTEAPSAWVTYEDPDRVLHQRSNLFADVRSVLPDHQTTFHAFDTGPITLGDGSTARQQFGLATFVSPRLSLTGSAAAFVHGAFAHHESWPAEDRPRLAHLVRVADDVGRTALVGHTHGVRSAHGKGDSPDRRRQAERLCGLIETTRRSDDLVVVGGDLNVLPDSVTFDVLGRIGLVDLVGETPTRTSAYAKPVRHADYLLVSDPSAVGSFEVVTDPEVSDHRPLVLDL